MMIRSIVSDALWSVGCLLVFIGIVAVGMGGPSVVQAQKKTKSNAESSARLAHQQAVMDVAARVSPAVVQIEVETLGERSVQPNPFQGTPFEGYFGGADVETEPYYESGLGSGVIVNPNGFIVTNDHVVDGAERLDVVLADGRRFDASIVGQDNQTDIALLKIEAKGLPTVSFGESDALRPGQTVLAFGSPLSEDLSNTVTSGIVSAVGRLAPGPEQTVQTYIQTDAAINPGNSGGPLVSLDGKLVGINAAIYSQTGGNQGIGFAIPANTVQRVVEQLVRTGQVAHARLGVNYSPVTPSLRAAYDLPPGALLVERVVAGSGAAQAGLQYGDILVAADGTTLDSRYRLGSIIGERSPGESLALTLVRDGERTEVSVPLDDSTTPDYDSPDAEALREMMESPTRAQARSILIFPDAGFALQDCTPETAEQLSLGCSGGAIIAEILPTSDAYRDGYLRRRMVIVEANRQPVRSVQDFVQIYDEIKTGSYVLLRLRLPGADETLTTALRKDEE
jgi:serine protease Do